MTKFVRTLIIINGLIIPLFVLILLGTLAKDFFRPGYSDYKPEAINVSNTITSEGDTLIRQGLTYSSPVAIFNSSNFMITVSPKTFEEPRKTYSKSVHFEGGSPYSDSYSGYLNILFLDAHYQIIGKLLDRKGYISQMDIPREEINDKPDTTIKNIAYEIAFADNNKDGKIDWNDNSDLYITNLKGEELIPVTKDIDIEEFKFINSHRELFISYTDRTSLKSEYKVTRFAIYTIGTKQLKKLIDIDKELNRVQKILN